MSRQVRRVVTSLVVAAAFAAGAGAADEPATPCNDTLADLYTRLSPAVVSLSAASIDPTSRTEDVIRVEASGFIIDSDGTILTNSHVVYNRQAIFATLDDGTTLPAKLLGADPIFDLAVIRIQPPKGVTLPVLPFGDSNDLRVGDQVMAIGNPLGLDQTLTHGIVSSIDRFLPEVPYSLTEPLIQIDAPINPGNSGGPLIDRCGQVVGITTSILEDAQGISFAIPIDLAAQVVPMLLHDGRVIRPWFGVKGQIVTPDLQNLLRAPLEPGLLVEVVDPGSPAAKAGVRGGQLDLVIAGRPVLIGGDVLTTINGRTLDTPEAFADTIRSLRVGATVHFTIYRDGVRREEEVTLPERPLLPGDLPSDADAAAAGLPKAHGKRPSIRRLAF
jgi:S1-C subfamily serine protease